MRGWRCRPEAALEIRILSACRTPLGAFGGALSPLEAPELGARAAREALARAGIEAEELQDLFAGIALPAGLGPNPARRLAREAGLPEGVPTCSVGQGALSSLKALALGMGSVERCGGGPVLVVGCDSPSRAPFLLPGARWGVRFGATALLDSVLLDGLGLGLEADLHPVAAPSPVGEAWAARSQARAQEAQGPEGSAQERVPIRMTSRKGPAVFENDEPQPGDRAAGPTGSRPPFADGAAAIMLAGPDAPDRPDLARILGLAEASTTASGLPASGQAIQHLLQRTGLDLAAIDAWEVAEGTTETVPSFLQALPGIDPSQINRRGGALALGHLLGTEGLRMLVSLLSILQDEGGRIGALVQEDGDGHAMALLLERR